MSQETDEPPDIQRLDILRIARLLREIYGEAEAEKALMEALKLTQYEVSCMMQWLNAGKN